MILRLVPVPFVVLSLAHGLPSHSTESVHENSEYISIKKTDNNCLTKDEFVTYYTEESNKKEESFNRE